MRKMRYFALLVMILFIFSACVTEGGTMQPGAQVEIPQAMADEPTQNDETQVTAPHASTPVDEIIVAITRDENTLTPFTYVTGLGLEVMRLIYDSLFAISLDGEIIPWMVEDDYSIDRESRIFTMTLRDGLFWHDGTPLTAEDIRFTFEYALTQTQTVWRNIASQVEDIEISGSEITITLYQGNPDFLRTGLANKPIVAQHIFEGVEDAAYYTGPTIGSSLFQLIDYTAGRYYVFEKVEGYFRGESIVSRINMPIMSDDAAITQALMAGQISAATMSIGPEVVSEFEAAAGIEVHSGRGFAPMMMLFNCERELLNEVKFRHALRYALDIEAMMNTITLGHGTVAPPGFITPDMPHAVTELVHEYNPDRANEILDELGFRKVDGVRQHNNEPITFSLLVQSGNTTRIRAAELIRGYFEEIGILLTINSMEFDTVDSFVWPGFDVAEGRDYDMTMWGWSAPVQLNPMALTMLGMSDHELGSFNLSGMVDEEFDRLGHMFLETTVQEERDEISQLMQVRFAELAPFVNLWHTNLNFAVNAEHFDGWEFQHATGIINRFSFLP